MKVGDEFESLPVTVKKNFSIKAKEYENEVRELQEMMDEKKAAYNFKSNSLESLG